MKTKNSIISTVIIATALSLGFWSFVPSKDFKIEPEVSSKKIYCELIYNSRIDPKTALSVKYEYIMKLWINYGAFTNYSNAESENKNVQSFEDYIEALNYLGSQGWRLIHRYRLELGTGFTQDIFLMEKEN